MIACYTETGMVDLSQFAPEDYGLHLCSRALSRINRFCGHTEHPYSVAQHAVVTSYLVPDWCRFIALHHDDAEAWIGDMPRNVKRNCKPFQILEMHVERAIWEALLGYQPDAHSFEFVKNADNWALRLEQINLQHRSEFGEHDVTFNATPHADVSSALDTLQLILTPRDAQQLYLARHNELVGGL